ncbi:MAG: lactate utilization protein [Clostridiales bacterium]|nr:lactate utilization protein [Clostridiales bacterium]
MTPMEKRNSLLGAQMVEDMKKRGMEGYYCATKEEAIKKALELIPEGSTVSWGGSATIRDMGLTQALKEGNYQAFDRDGLPPAEQQELYRKVFSMDYYVTSTNAITTDGLMINVDGNSNRIAAIAFGPKNVLVVTGMNKVCQSEEAAMIRARSIASPINAARFDIATPCNKVGMCRNCLSPDCICNEILITRRSKPAGRIKVILVGEELGF